MIFGGCAKIRHARGLWCVPPLPIVDAPGMDHDDDGLTGAKMIRHFDNSASIVTPTPGANVKVGIRIAHDSWGLPTIGFTDRFDPFGIFGEQWFGMCDARQFILIRAGGFLARAYLEL